MNHYHLSETISNMINLVYTVCFFPNARLIRRPFYIRGKKAFSYGKGFTCGYGCRFDLTNQMPPSLVLGTNVLMGDSVHIVALSHVEIGDDCLFASKIFISDTHHGSTLESEPTSSPLVPPNNRPIHTKPVIIGKNVWIGEAVSILPGVTIGNGVIIGANSLVSKNVPDFSMVVGNPARVIKIYDFEKSLWVSVSKEVHS